jgi:outer membrane biosynthesis protein TonB
MRRRPIVLIASLLASGIMLGGCSTFDPTEWFNQKKPLPGERKAMFPDGVPGVAQGVPPELVEGYREKEPPPPQVAEEKPKPKPKPRPQQAAAPRPAPPQQQRAAPEQSQSVFPEPPRR